MKSENARPLRSKRQDNVQPILREDRTSVQALSRALSLLEILGEDDDGYRLIDLAERSGLPSPTVHRLLTTMQQKRFVSFEPEKNLWHIGAQCFSVGSVFGRRRNIVERATPIMRRLRDVAGETVNLGGMDQDDVLLLHQIESKQMVRAISRPGSRSPLANTAMGKSILAWLPAERVTEVIQHGGLQRLTPQSIARGTTLHGALAGIRTRGYAIDNEETAMGLRCVAAAVFNEFGVAVAAVSVVGPTSRVTSDRVESLGQSVMAATRDITVLVGGRLPREMPAMAVPNME
jgi:IclR family transcriptional regulator, acetate operon repressor